MLTTTATHGSSNGKVHSLLEGLGEAKAKTFYDDSRCECVLKSNRTLISLFEHIIYLCEFFPPNCCWAVVQHERSGVKTLSRVSF